MGNILPGMQGGVKVKKDNVRDYATEAFRFYAACGRLTSEELKQRVYNEIYSQYRREYLRSGSGMPSDATAYAVIAAEDAVRDMKAEIEDIIAVEKTLKQLRQHHKQAVEMVYFVDADKPLKKGDISSRVRMASLSIPADESSVYRYLAYARRIFAEERGLRITKKEPRIKIASSRTLKSGIMVPSNSEGE